jgi:Calx-beta domain
MTFDGFVGPQPKRLRRHENNEPLTRVTVRLGQAIYWTTEGNDTVWLVVERGNDVAQEPFTVQYATSDLTAKAGLDYFPRQNVLSAMTGSHAPLKA